ncbi:MAG: hypothetical protein AAFX93_14630 [Verrucomicrobiota bacterium]
MKKLKIPQPRIGLLVVLAVGSSLLTTQARRVGDPGVTFDTAIINQNANDSSRNYDQMHEWKNAGRVGGIPWYSQITASGEEVLTQSDIDILQTKINDAHFQGNLRSVKISNSTFNFKWRFVDFKNGVVLLGSGKNSTKIRCRRTSTTGTTVFNAYNERDVGIVNMEIEYYTNTGLMPQDYLMENQEDITGGRDDTIVNMINFAGPSNQNCWIQGSKVTNAGHTPITMSSRHCTLRDTDVEGAYNKGAGGSAYIRIFGESNLVYNNTAGKIRHVSIQTQASKYNVVIRNNFSQDISFHTDDGGYNLVESNTANLDAGMINANPQWHAFLTVWSVVHDPVGDHNIVYKNTFQRNGVRDTCFVPADPNNPQTTSWNVSNMWWGTVYRPWGTYHKCFRHDLAPHGGTFYPTTNVTY